jgi:acetoin:2,6-dichlorophenolindophenol oxidoreductase subunit alpha
MSAAELLLSQADLLRMYRYLVLGREMAQAFGRTRSDWHSAEGEEAVVVGTFYGLRPSDVLSPHYRGCEIVSYMRGDSVHRIFASILGKATGISLGRHKNEFCGSFKLNIIGLYSGVLGPNICYGAGAALAMKLQSRDEVSVISFGDGTANRGEFHETLRTCAMLKLPAVFVCQNNQYAISMAADRARRRARARGAGTYADRSAHLPVHRALGFRS